MPFRPTFDCLWCGTRHETRSTNDLEGWAQLCPSCVGRAGDNEFLKFRLRRALDERGSAARVATPATADPGDPADRDLGYPEAGDIDAAQLWAYYDARAPEYDDWYLRRGRYARGPADDEAWATELQTAGDWVDTLPIGGQILEIATGTGWWSPRLARRGALTATDAVEATLARAQARLTALDLRADFLVRDAWAEPDRVVDALFAGFWLSHLRDDQLDPFLALLRRWLRPGGIFAAVDSLPDAASSAIDHPAPVEGRSVRRLDDGREFEIVKVFHSPASIRAGLAAAGFITSDVSTTGRFFQLVVATA